MFHPGSEVKTKLPDTFTLPLDFTEYPTTMTKSFRLVCMMMVFAVFVLSANDCGAADGIDKQKRAWQIEQLVLQRKILKAMDLYKEFSKESVERVIELRKLLGDTPYFEAVELFQSGKVPSKLIPAESEWKKLTARDTYRWGLRIWLDRRAKENQLVQFELKIEDLDARIKIGDVLTEKDQEEFNRWRNLAMEIDIPNVDRMSQAEQLEAAAFSTKWLENTMSNSKKGDTK